MLRVYTSRAKSPFSEQELVELIASSRRKNAEAGITGLLLYVEGSFIQAFEGPYEAVEKLHSRIKSDPRHEGILDLVTTTTSRRSFPNWSMGLATATSKSLQGIDGLSDYLSGGDLDSQITDRKAWIMLDHFRRTMVRGA